MDSRFCFYFFVAAAHKKNLGEGHFYNIFTLTKNGSLDKRSQIQIGQSTHDILLLNAIKNTLSAGHITPANIAKDPSNLVAAKSATKAALYRNKDIETFIPIFDKYPLLTSKRFDYQNFKEFIDLIEKKIYLTKEGYEKITQLLINMNSGRNGKTLRKFLSFDEFVKKSVLFKHNSQ